MKNNKKFETNSIRAGSIRSDQGEHSEALYLTSSFIFKDAEEAAARLPIPMRVMFILGSQIHL